MARKIKIWIILGITILSKMESIYTQSFEYVHQNGSFSAILAASKLNSGKWILVVQNNTQGDASSDSLSIVFLDTEGQFEKSELLVLNPLFSRIEFEWLQVLPGDDFIVAYGIGDCDVGSAELILTKYNAEGNEIWEQRNLSIFSPDDIRLSIEKDILVLAEKQVFSISAMTGEIQWNTSFTSDFINRGVFSSDSGDILFYNSMGLHFGRLESIAGEYQYVIGSSQIVPFDLDFFKYFRFSNGTTYYTYSLQYGGIIRLNQNLEINLIIPLSTHPEELIIDSSGVWVLVNLEDFNYQLSRYNTSGVLLQQYKSTLGNIWTHYIQKVRDNFILAGEYGSGTFLSDVATYYHAARIQAWMEYGGVDVLFTPLDSFNISVSGATQDAAINVDSVYLNISWPGRYYYSFAGGDFSIEVTNTGSKSVHSFWINTGFGPTQGVNCSGGINAKQIYYSGLDLQPGSSVWLPFGDINALFQEDYPYEFCFWTSGPNITPDIYHLDDVYCSSFIVPTDNIEKESILITPNPANTEIHVQAIHPMDTGSWEIFNLQGMRLLSGPLAADSTAQTISIHNLSPGIYVLRFGNSIVRVVVF